MKEDKELLLNVVKAWESLPGDSEYSAEDVEHWLAKKMKPAIDKIRVHLNLNLKPNKIK